ncbi:MAG: hypothetical protein FIA97_00280, partial [Methylococcaceae bacterium]|nr:hypothetical protein [Methylococcaceae bacterium]
MNRFRKSTPCARAVRLALAASLLASGAAQAILRDHGEGDPTLNFPLWYRDFNGTPLQICRSTASDGNGAFCFPLTPEAVPPSFAGNIGPEAFYMNLNANVTNGGIDLRYVAALEAAYGTANPVGAARLGQEVLFARTRFVMHVNTTDGSCAGNYRIVHPYGDDEFQDVGEGKRALFSTLDTPIGAINDFEGALRGQLGPFLHWDDGLETPLPHLSSGTERFIGNPAVLHTYTGSSRMEMKKDAAGNDTNIPIYLIDGTLNTGNLTLQFDANGIPINESLFQHQNYVKVFAPLGCDIGGTAAPAGEGINVLKVNTGFLLGQVWTAAIATPTRVTAAEYSRAPDGSTAIDVWASSEPNNTLVASTSSTPGLVLREEFDTLGRRTGSYHGHIQMAPGAVLPGQVTVNNLTSPALIGVTANIVDTVTITNSAFNPATGSLCVTAHSSDRFDKPALTVAAGPLSESLGTPTLAKLADCGLSALPDADDVLFAGDLPNAPPEVTEPPATVTVSSQREGRHTTPLTVVSAGANTPAPLAAADDFMGGNSDTAITFDVRTNDTPSAAAAGATVMIARQPQPATGSVVVNADNTVTFTPAATITANTTDNFVYALRSGDGVSNQATVALNLTFVSRP